MAIGLGEVIIFRGSDTPRPPVGEGGLGTPSMIAVPGMDGYPGSLPPGEPERAEKGREAAFPASLM